MIRCKNIPVLCQDGINFPFARLTGGCFWVDHPFTTHFPNFGISKPSHSFKVYDYRAFSEFIAYMFALFVVIKDTTSFWKMFSICVIDNYPFKLLQKRRIKLLFHIPTEYNDYLFSLSHRSVSKRFDRTHSKDVSLWTKTDVIVFQRIGGLLRPRESFQSVSTLVYQKTVKGDLYYWPEWNKKGITNIYFEIILLI